MGSSEPTLVPEWLRSNGHGNSGASGSHQFTSANSHSDTPLLANSARIRTSRTITEIDSPRAILDRSPSINSGRSSSSNGSSKHPYSSFSRSHRDKEREKEKERSGFGNIWERDSSVHPDKDSLRRTRSMVSRKQSDSLPRRVASDFKKIESINHLQRNGLAVGERSASSVPKLSFEKDFPSLGADEKQMPNVVRVASPGLTIAAQGLPIGSSALIGEGWSALAEVPAVIGSNNSTQCVNNYPAASVAPSTNSGGLNAVFVASDNAFEESNTLSGGPKTSGALGPSSGLNMAEALVLSPSVSRTTPQLSVETQRLEQMSIKKVRQLIPVTPAMSKVSSSDKLKPKFNARVGEMGAATKVVGQQLSSSSLNAVGQSTRGGPVASTRGGPVTSEASKQSHGGKLFVLKPPWENGASASSKDGSNPEGTAAVKLGNNPHAIPTVSSAPVRTSDISNASIGERKANVSSLSRALAVEKRPLSSHAQSRSAFYNSVRKNTLKTTAVASEANSSIHSPSEENSCGLLKEMTYEENSVGKVDSSTEDDKFPVRETTSSFWVVGTPDEEEAALLRSLGWDEYGEEEALTEEEISAFYQEVMKSSPLKLPQGVQPALSLLKRELADPAQDQD